MSNVRGTYPRRRGAFCITLYGGAGHGGREREREREGRKQVGGSGMSRWGKVGKQGRENVARVKNLQGFLREGDSNVEVATLLGKLAWRVLQLFEQVEMRVPDAGQLQQWGLL